MASEISTPEKSKTKRSWLAVKSRRSAIALAWTYTFLHSHIDRRIGDIAPSPFLKGFSLIHQHRTAVGLVVGSLLLIAILQKPKRTLKLIGFAFECLMFPLVVLFWLLPVNLYRAARILYLVANLVIRLACSFRFILLLLAFCAWSIWAIFTAWHPGFRPFYAYVVLVTTIFIYVQVFRLLLSPAALYNTITGWMLLGWSKFKDKFEETMAIVPLDEAGAAKIAKDKQSQVQTLKLLEKGATKVLSHLDWVNRRNFVVKVFLVVLAVYFVLIVVSFSVQFYGLSPSFEPRNLSYFDFLYFSLTNILTANFGDIVPLGPAAKLLACIEVLFGFGLAVIVLLVFTSVSIERFSEDLKALVEKLSAEMVTIQALLEREDVKALVTVQPGIIADK